MSTPIYVTKFGNIQGINAGVEAYVNQQIKTAVEPLVSGIGTSIVDAVPRYLDNTGKKVESTPVTIENVATLFVPGGVNIGDRLTTSDYYLPGNRGTVGQVITMFNANSSVWQDPIAPVVPSFVNSLTVNNLAQGTSLINQNYILPTYAPSIDNVRYALTAMNLGSVHPAYIDVTQLSTFSFLVNAINVPDTYTISFTIGVGKYIITNFTDLVVTGIRTAQQGHPVTYVVAILFDGVTFSITIPATTPTPINFVSFDVAPFAPTNLGNGLLGGNASSSTTFTIGSQPFPNPPPTYVPAPPVAKDLEWYPTNFIQNSISTTSGTSSIQCNEVGDITVNGSLNMGSANINNVNALNSTDATLTASCGQSQLQIASVADGLSLSTTTKMGATNGLTSAALACTVDTALMVRNNVHRVIVNDDVNINDSSSVGRFVTAGGYTSVRAGTGVNDRIDIDGSGLYIAIQGLPVFNIFPGAGGTSRLWSPNTSHVFSVENNNGVRINNAYYLPNADGTAGQVLTTNGSGQSSWVTPSSGLFSQTGTKTVNNIIEATLLQTVGSVGSLSIPANYLTLGKSLLFKIGGSFRDNANNTLIRFRFKTNGINLLDTGNITLDNVNTVRAWNIEIQTTYNGANMITNFMFRYTTPNITGQSFHFQTTAPINTTIINTLDLTVNWTVLSPNNTITSNYATLTKIY